MGKTILKINSSGRTADSVSRKVVEKVVAKLQSKHEGASVVDRDVTKGLPFVDETIIGAFHTPKEKQTEAQKQAIAASDKAVQELIDADILVIGAPMYNFTIPGALKAYIDLVCRPGLTFNYTENGPVGLLKGKKAYIVSVTGGVPTGSPADFSTPYLKYVLAFIGVTDVEVILADELVTKTEARLEETYEAIAAL